MDIYALNERGVSRVSEVGQGERTVWIDVQRTDADWPQQVRRLLGVAIYERHLSDLQNDRHPPFYDGSDQYDMLIVRSPDRDSPPEADRKSVV